MISILIPVFNAYVHDLVQELSNQLSNLPIEGEILVYDDFSDLDIKSRNALTNSIKYVVYKELDRNFGRIEIRKMLASDARYNWLLFVDSDSVIIRSSYLQNYVKALEKRYDVYTGGTVYQAVIPEDCAKRLHWLYGSKREAAKGSKPTLHTNNFVIQKKIFLELNFPSQLKGYGHEDTWVHIKLDAANKKIFFLNNPVLHSGLESTEIFLKKTKNALKNLLALVEVEGKKAVKARVKLIQLYLLIEQLSLKQVVQRILHKRIKKIEMNLNSCNPSLFQFDLYRLYHLLLKNN